MAITDEIHDSRSEFWRDHFERADSYDQYLAASDPDKALRWRELEAKLPALTDDQVRRLGAISRQMNVLVYSGVWCGDCVRQGPMLRRIVEACGPDVKLRIIDRDASGALREELRILGGARVPVVMFLSEDFFEVGRFGDRLLAAYRRMAAAQLGPACPTGLVPPTADELAAEMADWVDVFERMGLMLRLSGWLRKRHGD